MNFYVSYSFNRLKLMDIDCDLDSFSGDLDQLQLSRSQAMFNAAAKLFLAKWKPFSKPLVAYFEKEWLIANINWYEGFEVNTPSHNNGIEGFNKVIKSEHTLRERLELSQFRVVFFDMIEQWSTEYAKNLNSINLGPPTMKLEWWTQGYNFARSNTKITSLRSAGKITYSVPVADLSDPVRTDSNYIAWKSFNEFKRYAFAIVHTTFDFPITSDNWIDGICDCSDGFKLFMCQHKVGIALRLKVIAAPIEAKNIPIGQKRKRGRPAKAKTALQRQ